MGEHAMGSDPNQYMQERAQRNRQERDQGLKSKQTLEMVELEKQGTDLPDWQRRVVNVLAVIGGGAIVYVILDLLF
jgi:hypothetical protein